MQPQDALLTPVDIALIEAIQALHRAMVEEFTDEPCSYLIMGRDRVVSLWISPDVHVRPVMSVESDYDRHVVPVPPRKG